MRDRRPERRGLRSLRVDVDELMVVGDVGELVDLVLRHLEPLSGTFVGADVTPEQFECLGGRVTHGTRRYDVRPCARPFRQSTGTPST